MLWDETAIIFSNLAFIPPIFIFLWKRKYIVSLFFLGLTIASTLYHLCYIPLHVLGTDYYFADYCPVGDTESYGIVLLFFDYLFATACSMHMCMFLVPKTGKDSIVYRTFFVVLGMAIVVLIAVNVGFFPPINGILYPVTNQSPKLHRFIGLSNTALWGKIISYTSVLSHLERSHYINSFMMLYGSIVLIAHFISYLSNYHAQRSFHKDGPVSMGLFHQIPEKIWYFYKTRYNPVLFVLSLVNAIIAFIFWLILQKVFPKLYLEFHSVWHILLGLGAALFGLSLPTPV